MKNIDEILKEVGVEVPEDKKADFDKLWKENYRTKVDYDKVVGDRDSYKESLTTVQSQLDGFKDVDVDELKNQIVNLQNDLKTKDAEYEAKELARVFNDSVNEAIKTAGGKNTKAVRALLDIDNLRESKNQKEDISAAISSLKESDAYLFSTDEPFSNPVGGLGGNGGGEGGKDNLSAIRAAMGLPKTNK